MRNLILPFVIFISISLSAYSQSEEVQEAANRPKIGLVLSGGAAKGIAHVGVLQVLEEVGIRPDYITGTSMGAIIGGLYSIGYSADDLAKLADEIDWNKMLTDEVPLNKIVMEEKEEFERYLLEFPIRNKQFNLPSGLTEGYQLERLFRDLTWGATDIQRFDSLPIPFHCVALDLVEGQTIEFKEGHLPTAIRASMAIPGVFAPIQVDTMMLVDGGVRRNLPVQEVIDMGADIVIAVYVGFEDDVTPEDLLSVTNILTRTTIYLGVLDSKKQMKLADYLILPDMKGVNSTDFFSSDTIISRGKKAAEELKEELQHLADSLNLYFKPVKKPQGPEYIYITDVVVENLHHVEKSFVIGRGNIFPGTYSSKEELDEAVERLYGTQYFRKVGYRLEHVEGMKYKLIYMTKEKTRGLVKIAPHYDNQLGTGITLNGTLRNYFIPSSRIKMTVNIAENPGLKFNIDKYVGKEQKLMAHNFIRWNKAKLPVFYQGENIGNYLHGYFQFGIGGKYSLDFNQQVGFDFFYESNSVEPSGGVSAIYPQADFENYGFGGFAYKFHYHLNTLNDLFFATEGTKIDLELKHVMRPISSYSIEEDQSLDEEILMLDLKPFNTLYFNLDQYFKISKPLSMNFGTSLGLSSNNTPITNHFALGGNIYTDKYLFESFFGLNFGEHITPNFWKIDGGFNYQLMPRIFITLQGNIALSANNLDQFIPNLRNYGVDDYMKGYAGGLRFNTPLGPIVLMAGDVSTDARTHWYISLGYTF